MRFFGLEKKLIKLIFCRASDAKKYFCILQPINLPLLSLLLPPFFDFFSAFSEFFFVNLPLLSLSLILTNTRLFFFILKLYYSVLCCCCRRHFCSWMWFSPWVWMCNLFFLYFLLTACYLLGLRYL